jgi:hypothetical protein
MRVRFDADLLDQFINLCAHTIPFSLQLHREG